MDSPKVIEKSQFLELKQKLKQIYLNSNIIHIDVCQKRKKLNNISAKINGIYDNFLCVESNVNGYIEDFTISYIDILMNNILIYELY